MHRIHVLTISALLLLNCQTKSVDLILQPGFSLDSADKEIIIDLSNGLNFHSPYQIEAGIFGKYDSSKAIAVKQVAVTNDTLQQEKWLYVWRREWVNSQLFRSFGDSSVARGDFITGEKCVRIVNKYVYKYGSYSKIFQFANGKGRYGDVKLILDCILSGTAIEDRMGFKKEAGENWDFVKKNVLEFKSVTCWGAYYSFEYEFPQLQHPHVGFNAKRIGDSCEIISFKWVGAGN